MKTLKYFIILALLVAAGFLSWNVYFKVYTQEDKVNIHLFPKTIGEWTSKELTITDYEYEILETRNAFARKYTTPEGKRVYIFMVYSENNRKVSHPPEVCYQGSGLTVTDSSHQPIKISENQNLNVVNLMLEQRSFQQMAYYWFKVGDTFTSSYWKQQMLIAFKTLFGQPSNSALIRVSVDVEFNDVGKAQAHAQEFIRLILPEIPKYLP